MANLRRSLVVTFFSSSGAALVKFIVSIILARLLSPSEIGVYSITVVFVNIAHTFRDFGVGTYLQREPDLDSAKIRSALGVAIASSWLIAALLYAASGSIGKWFNEPDIVPVMEILALGFLFIPFGSITNALLTRELAAEKQAVINAAGTLAFCVSCVLFATLGYGSVGLAWANFINIIVTTLACIPFRPKNVPWLPGFQHWRGVVHFGAGNLIYNIALKINEAVPDVLLGKLGNASLVGLFSRANSTVAIFSHVAGTTVSYGAVSYLAKAYHAKQSLAPILTRSSVLLTGVGWPALALTGVLGHDIVLALYGAAWLDCVPAVLPLAIAAMVSMMYAYTGMGLTAIGRPYLGAMPVGAMLLSRIGFGVAMYDGNIGTFGWAFCLATIASTPVRAYQQYRHLGFANKELFRALVPSALVSLVCAAAGWLGSQLLPASLPPVVRLLLLAAPLALTWYAALVLCRHEVLGEIQKLGNAAKVRLLRFV